MAEPRLDSLITDTDTNQKQVGKTYSSLVKILRVGLPLAALILVFIVIYFPKMEEELIVIPKEDVITQPENEIGENELLSPKFESVDSNQNPILVTAKRALYSQDNPNLVTLENPNANLKTSNGEDVFINALTGTYEQKTRKLFLQDEIEIIHASGYVLHAQELRVDIQRKQAFSDKAIEINGSNGTVIATGLAANMQEGILTFKGPATLTLTSTKESE